MSQNTSQNFFRQYFAQSDHRAVIKMDHYLDVYHKKLGSLQGQNVNFLEIGIYRGGSIGMWKSFWGDQSRLTFVDIDENAKRFAQDGVNIEIGDQGDFDFMHGLGQTYGPFHLIIDDGGHKMDQQITSFKALWPHLHSEGLYIIEDTHTSYWKGFGGGHKNPASTIEFAKNLVDELHSWYSEDDENFPPHDHRHDIESVSFYDSMILIKKTRREEPVSVYSENGKLEYSYASTRIKVRKSIF